MLPKFIKQALCDHHWVTDWDVTSNTLRDHPDQIIYKCTKCEKRVAL